MNFLEKVKGFLFEPSKTFDYSKDDTLAEGIKYYAIFLAIDSAIFALLMVLVVTLFGEKTGNLNIGFLSGAGIGIVGTVLLFMLLFLIFLIIGFMGIIIEGAIVHICVYIIGGRKGIGQTMKAVMYGSTPELLLMWIMWIPVIGIIGWTWSIVLEIIGIRQLHNLSTGRAALAMFLPIIIVAGFFIVVVIASLVFGMRG